MVKDGDFRQDLYYRINVIGVSVASLADRSEDIPLLAGNIIDKYNSGNSTDITINDGALQALVGYPFPGNVRELENILERATALCEGNQITHEDLHLPSMELDLSASQTDLGKITQDIEVKQITLALEQNRWNQSATARALGITLRQLRYKIEKLELNKS